MQDRSGVQGVKSLSNFHAGTSAVGRKDDGYLVYVIVREREGEREIDTLDLCMGRERVFTWATD